MSSSTTSTLRCRPARERPAPGAARLRLGGSDGRPRPPPRRAWRASGTSGRERQVERERAAAAPTCSHSWISPPSRRASSRLIVSPSPVPPYIRLVEASACWNASKMICCLSRRNADARYPMIANASAAGARRSVSALEALRVAARSRSAARPSPVSVNLNAFESRFLRICCSRCGSVVIVGGASARDRDRRSSSPCCMRDRRGSAARRSRATSPSGDALVARSPCAGLDLRQVEDLVDSARRSRPAEWMVLAYSTCCGVRFFSSLSASSCARIIMLFSGVRSSCDMLARNSDLYLETSASCLAFSSSDRARLGDLAVADLEQLRLLLELVRPRLELGVRALGAPGAAPRCAARADHVDRRRRCSASAARGT